MSKVCIIGTGAWGKAMHHVISQNAKYVRMVGRGEVVSEDIIVIAVPTNNIRELSHVLKPRTDRPVIINTAKGVEERTHKLPREIIMEMIPTAQYFSLIGPGFAAEVMADMPTIVNLGYGALHDEVGEIAGLFQTETFRVRQAEAIHILELSAALKNIYAIGCGLADGLGNKNNTRSLLTVVAIEEVQNLLKKLGLGIGPNCIPGTIGDLMLTCNSAKSRNFTFGRHLVTTSVSKALERAKGVVEGYTSLSTIEHWERQSESILPLASFIVETVLKDEPKTLPIRFKDFISCV